MLGRVRGLKGYHDVRSYPQARHLPGLVIYRFDAPLFFANVKTFRDEVRRLARADSPPSWIVIAAEHFFPTIGAAVAAFRDQTGARWTAAERTVPARHLPT